MKNNQLKIALIVGGASPERAVSKESGYAMYEALNRLEYEFKVIDPAYGLNQPDSISDFFTEKDYSEVSHKNYVECINSGLFKDVDLALLALHGKWGEDGTIQSLFEFNDIKYTGSGVLGSSLTMDKARSKVMFTHFGVSTPRWLRIISEDDIEKVKYVIEKEIKYPCIVKPNDSGSTLGLSKCTHPDEIEAAVSKSLSYSEVVLIEQFIAGREIAVGIIGEKILPLLEIIPQHEIYDYECKYKDGMSEYIVPADIPADIESRLKNEAKIAYDSLGCENYARVDFRLEETGNIYCFEVNTLPGMTSHSLLPKMAKADGIEFNDLIDLIIKSAL